MVFKFTNNPEARQVLDMALEATFEGGRVVQAMCFIVQTFHVRQRNLMYREGATGKWLSSDGISFNGLPKTPENLVRVIGGADPIQEIYVIPAL